MFQAHRTYYIGEVGDYFLETQSVAPNMACNNFNVKMECGGGAEAAAPSTLWCWDAKHTSNHRFMRHYNEAPQF